MSVPALGRTHFSARIGGPLWGQTGKHLLTGDDPNSSPPDYLSTEMQSWWGSGGASPTTALRPPARHGIVPPKRGRPDQPRPRPEVAIERDARLAFARLLRELDLGAPPPMEPRPPGRMAEPQKTPTPSRFYRDKARCGQFGDRFPPAFLHGHGGRALDFFPLLHFLPSPPPEGFFAQGYRQLRQYALLI